MNTAAHQTWNRNFDQSREQAERRYAMVSTVLLLNKLTNLRLTLKASPSDPFALGTLVGIGELLARRGAI